MSVDTLKIAHRLQSVGASKELAEEQAQILREVVEDEGLATKTDLREAVTQLRAEMLRLTLAQTGVLAVIIALIEFLR